MQADSTVWSFEEIAASDPARAKRLEEAPPAESIAAAILAAFKTALRTGGIRIGMEQSCSNPKDLRVILQFHIGEALSDCFFNSNTGYRAEFSRGWRRGLDYNCGIITQIHALVEKSSLTTHQARLLTHKFKDCGSLAVTSEQICTSLVPNLSKVWFCARLISEEGHVTELMSGVVGPRLRLDEARVWAAITRDDESSWLDVKGAFIGSHGLYQRKDPIDRAKMLEETGEA
jgi:hypothetical protein